MSVWTEYSINGLLDTPVLDKFIENVYGDDEKYGLLLHLKFKSGEKILRFDFPHLFRVMDKKARLKELSKQNLNDKSWLFTVKESELMNWFNEESFGIYEGKFIHIVIITQEQVIDIFTDEGLTDSHPKIISTE